MKEGRGGEGREGSVFFLFFFGENCGGDGGGVGLGVRVCVRMCVFEAHGKRREGCVPYLLLVLFLEDGSGREWRGVEWADCVRVYLCVCVCVCA